MRARLYSLAFLASPQAKQGAEMHHKRVLLVFISLHEKSRFPLKQKDCQSVVRRPDSPFSFAISCNIFLCNICTLRRILRRLAENLRSLYSPLGRIKNYCVVPSRPYLLGLGSGADFYVWRTLLLLLRARLLLSVWVWCYDSGFVGLCHTPRNFLKKS